MGKTYLGKPEKFNFGLTGKTIDKQSGESLPFVNITVKGTTLGAASNVDGFFNLGRVPSDTSTLVVSYMGYETKHVFLTPQSPTNNVTIELSPAATQLQNVTITGQKDQAAPQSNEKVSMIKMTPAKIATLPNIGERDIFRSFQLMPGVSAANENAAGLYVRGEPSGTVALLMDSPYIMSITLFGFYSALITPGEGMCMLYKGI